MKAVNYRCSICEKNKEELYYDYEWEEIKDQTELEELCECGGTLLKFNFKNNQQVWKFLSAPVK